MFYQKVINNFHSLINSSLSDLFNLFMRYSSRDADERSGHSQVAQRLTGRRARVYLAPLPEL